MLQCIYPNLLQDAFCPPLPMSEARFFVRLVMKCLCSFCLLVSAGYLLLIIRFSAGPSSAEVVQKTGIVAAKVDLSLAVQPMLVFASAWIHRRTRRVFSPLCQRCQTFFATRIATSSNRAFARDL